MAVKKIVNRRKNQYDVYCGRYGPWGNPYDKGTREENILEFEKWILTQHDKLKHISELDNKILGCWCKPLDCHCDVLARLVDLHNHGVIQCGITGTQQGCTPEQHASLTKLLIELRPGYLHHGDCIGVDAQADAICGELEIKTIIHPPDDPKKRAYCIDYFDLWPERPYLDRNRDIVFESDLLIAVPKTNFEEQRSGTWATVRQARKHETPIIFIDPDGKIEKES